MLDSWMKNHTPERRINFYNLGSLLGATNQKVVTKFSFFLLGGWKLLILRKTKALLSPLSLTLLRVRVSN